MMHREVPAGLIAPFQQGKVDHPEDRKSILISSQRLFSRTGPMFWTLPGSIFLFYWLITDSMMAADTSIVAVNVASS